VVNGGRIRGRRRSPKKAPPGGDKGGHARLQAARRQGHGRRGEQAHRVAQLAQGGVRGGTRAHRRGQQPSHRLLGGHRGGDERILVLVEAEHNVGHGKDLVAHPPGRPQNGVHVRVHARQADENGLVEHRAHGKRVGQGGLQQRVPAPRPWIGRATKHVEQGPAALVREPRAGAPRKEVGKVGLRSGIRNAEQTRIQRLLFARLNGRHVLGVGARPDGDEVRVGVDAHEPIGAAAAELHALVNHGGLGRVAQGQARRGHDEAALRHALIGRPGGHEDVRLRWRARLPRRLGRQLGLNPRAHGGRHAAKGAHHLGGRGGRGLLHRLLKARVGDPARHRVDFGGREQGVHHVECALERTQNTSIFKRAVEGP
jgi:hypothetical protein